MDRISTLNKVLNLFGLGKHGFRDGDIANGIAPTELNAAWFNGVQEELLNVIEAGGVVPAAATRNQLLQALFKVVVGRGHGECVLRKVGANQVLLPYNGDRLVIDRTVEKVPSAGVSLAPTGLAVGTNYYLYAYMDAGVMKLQASTTGHSPDPVTGVEIKTGSSTHTLVGYARTVAGTAWVDSSTERFTLSYFNRRDLPLTPSGGNISGINTSDIERTSAARAWFLTWGDEAVEFGVIGSAKDTTASTGTVFVTAGVDGVSSSLEINCGISAADRWVPFSIYSKYVMAEGFHYTSTHARTASGSTGYINFDNFANVKG